MNDHYRNPQPSLKEYFIQTGFCDLYPLAMQLAKDMGYGQNEMIEAICKVNDKFIQYPPKRRTQHGLFCYSNNLNNIMKFFILPKEKLLVRENFI